MNFILCVFFDEKYFNYYSLSLSVTPETRAPHYSGHFHLP